MNLTNEEKIKYAKIIFESKGLHKKQMIESLSVDEL
jgi:hypothetical protein